MSGFLSLSLSMAHSAYYFVMTSAHIIPTRSSLKWLVIRMMSPKGRNRSLRIGQPTHITSLFMIEVIIMARSGMCQGL